LLLGMLAACTVITGDLGRTVAIEIDGELTKYLEEGETITLSAAAIDAAGDSVPDAVILWELLDTDPGFDLESTTGVIQGRFPGRGRVRARIEELRSDTVSIRISGAPDSIAAAGDTVITFAADVDVSPRLTSVLIDLTTDSAAMQPLVGKIVTYDLVEPSPGATEAQGFFLTVSETIPGSEPHSMVTTTDSASQAYVVLRRVAGSSLPDSAFVTANAATASGDIVRGSPVMFIVVFEQVP